MVKHKLAAMLKKYVTHKSLISRSSDHYKKLSYLAPLERCQSLVKRIPEMSSDRAAAVLILNNYKDLEKILPDIRNASFESSFQCLQDLMNECSKLVSNTKYHIH